MESLADMDLPRVPERTRITDVQIGRFEETDGVSAQGSPAWRFLWTTNNMECK